MSLRDQVIEKKQNQVKELTQDFSESDALFIGDSIVDIKTAQNASIRSVGVLWGNGTEEDFIKQKSDFILESPEEILNIL